MVTSAQILRQEMLDIQGLYCLERIKQGSDQDQEFRFQWNKTRQHPLLSLTQAVSGVREAILLH